MGNLDMRSGSAEERESPWPGCWIGPSRCVAYASHGNRDLRLFLLEEDAVSMEANDALVGMRKQTSECVLATDSLTDNQPIRPIRHPHPFFP